MNNVVKILIERDNMSEKEAIDFVKEIKEKIVECENLSDAEMIMWDYLGLEMDYIFDVIDIDM